MLKHDGARFRALGNMGDVLSRLGSVEEAIAVHGRQLALARAARDRGCEAAAYGALGSCHRQAKRFDKALGFHTQVRTRHLCRMDRQNLEKCVLILID